MRLAILVSGVGSIARAILESGITASFIMADRECQGLAVGEALGVPGELVSRSKFHSGDGRFLRADFSDLILEKLIEAEVDLVALAGFGTILEGEIHETYRGAMLNTHPSLLPSFPGWHAVESALAFGVKVTGTTVHLVVPEVDAGPILAQEPVRVMPGDDLESLHDRIKRTERRLYPAVIAASLRGYSEREDWWMTRQFEEALEEEVGRCVR